MFCLTETKISLCHHSHPSSFPAFPSNKNRKNKKVGVEKIKSKSHSREWVSERGRKTTTSFGCENYSRETKTITKVRFCLCWQPTKSSTTIATSFSFESAFREPLIWMCLWGISPHFQFCWKQNFPRHHCVQPENVYNHLKYITVECTSLCQPHIFLPFSIIIFLPPLLCIRRRLFAAVYKKKFLLFLSLWLGKTPFNNSFFTKLKNSS